MNEAALDRIVAFFESFSSRDLPLLGEFYDDDASFKDPFSEVRGLAPIRRIYAHMFEALHEPRFVVTSRMGQGNECWLAWEFRFRFRSWRPETPQVVRGASHLTLGADGRIRVHRDYWDAAEEVYEKLPLIGALMRWLKRQAAA
ncbi:nuclear transport factor 2 family protein [Caenimonas aquaedulcis]|uniref:Nuclear transport factor 2 family protein n=1 Tax=Caenimonas aquaedulcis TaxID=2793270 RepID=A0A931H6J0_9BURK|nr:nuclear transport factor 2 family protein [Caenimonas aquaedulcis]MBG9389575.1 nuclear transport factor 2 family protein [Caenimonas aquaedulcis]